MKPANARGEESGITPGRRRLPLGPCDGSAAVEFAMILPILLGLLVVMFDLGTGGYVKACLESAAQAGTTYVEAHGWDERGIVMAARNATNLPRLHIAATASCNCIMGTDIAAATCGDICPNGNRAGVFVKVSASAVYTPLIPYPGIDRSLTLSASSIVRVD